LGERVKKASEYRRNAVECRHLAAQMLSDEQRALLLQMAEQWEQLASDRRALVERHPELAMDGEQEEIRENQAQTRRCN
jgi:hypothetical protein